MKQAAIILCATTWLAVSGVAAGDEINVGGLTRRGTIVGVDDGQVVYRSSGGAERTVSLAEIESISLEGQSEFNAAETALAEGQFDQAIRNYTVAGGAARDPWVRQLIDLRKMQALDGAGRLDEALRLWQQTVGRGAASGNMLALMPATLAPAGSDANAAAIDLLAAAMGDSIETDTDQAIARLLLRLYQLEGLDAEAEQLLAMFGGEDDAPVVVERIEGDLGQRLGRARAMLDRPGGPDRVIETITADLNLYDTDLLPEALLVLGYASQRVAEAGEGEDAQAALVQAGLSFMHVATFFPRSSVAGEALYQAGRVNQALGDRLAARRAYEAVVSGYSENAAAAAAVAAATKALDEMETDE